MRQPRLHYAWIVAAATFVVLLMTAGIRATPGVLMVPLEEEFGWTRVSISAAVAVNIALFGLLGPFAASIMDRWRVRRVLLIALALLAGAVALSTQMRTEAHLMLLWGVLVGAGTGMTSMVLAAIVATRWFDARRGLVVGALSAANATGQLIFLPLLASLITTHGWRAATWLVAAAAALVFLIVAVFMRDRPEDVGLTRYGSQPAWRSARRRHWHHSRHSRAAYGRRRSGCSALTFFVCGASTNGLIGTHLIAACHDVGIPSDAIGAPARDDGAVRHRRHDGLRLADRSLLQPTPAARLLLAAWPLAPGAALHTR